MTPNVYPGTCYRCGKRVKAEAGLFLIERAPGLRWSAARFQRNWALVEHLDCHDRFLGTNVHYIHEPANE